MDIDSHHLRRHLTVMRWAGTELRVVTLPSWTLSGAVRGGMSVVD